MDNVSDKAPANATEAAAINESLTETSKPEPVATPSGPCWPDVAEDHPLSKFQAQLPSIVSEAGYSEVYGITLEPPSSFHSKLIMQKFLRASANDLAKAKEQLLATLKWRKEFQPLKTKEGVYTQKRFDGLGFVTILEGVPESPNNKDVATFNIYGAVKDPKATFEDLDGYDFLQNQMLSAMQSAGGPRIESVALLKRSM